MLHVLKKNNYFCIVICTLLAGRAACQAFIGIVYYKSLYIYYNVQ